MPDDERLSEKAKAFSIDSLLKKSTVTEIEGPCKSTDKTLSEDSYGGEVACSLNNSDSPVGSSSPEPVDMDCHEDRQDFPGASLAAAKCSLVKRDLWRKFHELDTEMIITKSGRRMFPSLLVTFSSLEADATYAVALDIGLVDNKRYRYSCYRSSWLVAGRADQPLSRRCYIHPDGPFRGGQLEKQPLSFEKVKLTNNSHDKWGYVVLNSMHKYQPRVHLIKYSEDVPVIISTSDLKKYEHKTFCFPETVFIGVTAYQNQLITKLKIDSNPFAKGFRESARTLQLNRESVDLLIRNGFYPSSYDGDENGFANSSESGSPTERQGSKSESLNNAYARTATEMLGCYYYHAYRLQEESTSHRPPACDKRIRCNTFAYI